MPEEPLVTAREVDAQIKVPVSTIMRMHHSGVLQGYYVGAKRRGIRFRVSEVLAALKTRPVPVTKKAAKKKAATTGKQQKG